MKRRIKIARARNKIRSCSNKNHSSRFSLRGHRAIIAEQLTPATMRTGFDGANSAVSRIHRARPRQENGGGRRVWISILPKINRNPLSADVPFRPPFKFSALPPSLLPPVTSREPPEILFSPRDPVGRVSGVTGTKLFLIKKNRAGQKPFCRDGNQRNPRIRLFGISGRASWGILIASFTSRVLRGRQKYLLINGQGKRSFRKKVVGRIEICVKRSYRLRVPWKISN